MVRKRIKQNLIHAIAKCQECNWEEEDYLTAQKEARKHAKKTGHEVILEEGYFKVYNDKGNRE